MPRLQIPHYWTAADAHAIVQATPAGRQRLFTLMAWRTGMRSAELLALRWGDIALNDTPPTITVKHGKGDRWRLVPIHPELASALAFVAAGNGDERLFNFTGQTARNIVRRAIEAAGLSWNTERVYSPGVHSLRHSAIRHWLASGIPLNVVSLWAGHAQITTTERIYLPLTPGTLGGDISEVS